MTTILSAGGSVEIPEEFRKTDDLKPGQLCEIERVSHGDYHVRVTDQEPVAKESWVKILRECPVKDWWEPLDHSNLLITRDISRLFEDGDADES
jgi:bifunctional DNA-binding transcriptional regulator/antitoxin component of YhaV-PrlF toxin-antitoxin module